MKEALFYTFLAIFVATAIITLLGVIKKVKIEKRYLNALFTALLLELIGAVIALFGAADFFGEAGFVRYVKPNQQEYHWEEPNVLFSYPRSGWALDTKRKQGGLGDLALVATGDHAAQVQVHYSALDPKYVKDWSKFLSNMKTLWQKQLSQWGEPVIEDIYIDGARGFSMQGRIPGEQEGFKAITIVYVPVSEEFFMEFHYTRNEDNHDAALDECYQIVLSTIRIGKI